MTTMPARTFGRMCVLIAVLVTAVAAGAVEAPLDEGQIRDAVSGNTGIFYDADVEVIKAYFGPGGELRGRHEGEDFDGSWSVRNDMLCLESPITFDLCHKVVSHDGTLQLFTAVGEPSGYFRIEPGNPENF